MTIRFNPYTQKYEDVITAVDFPVDETIGGTGQTTYTKGDILYASAANTLAKLPIGTNGHILKVDTDVPAWASPSAATGHAILSSTHTDALAASVVAGDMMIGNATPKWSRLAAGATLQGQRLAIQTTGLPGWVVPGRTVGLDTAARRTAYGAVAVTGERLALWADTLTLTEGLRVGTWNDSSGVGYNFAQSTAASKPYMRLDATTGIWAVEFDGLYFGMTGTGLMLTGATVARSFVAVVKIDSLVAETTNTQFNMILDMNRTAAGAGVGYAVGCDGSVRGFAANIIAQQRPHVGRWCIVSCRVQAAGNFTDIVQRIDGQNCTTASSTAAAISTGSGGASLGYSHVASSHLHGMIAGMRVWEANDATELSNVEAQMASIYGLALGTG